MKQKNKERVVFYLNKEDKELLNNQCELLQIKASFFIRNSVLIRLGKPIFNVKKQDLDTKKYTTELIRIGVNLNQIAKKLNSGGAKFLIADQQAVLNEIKNVNNHILEIKSKL
tara:strand:- start:12147 stop:12485 length:339 start_codon:yes stop_codon:yes gene_type:complete